MTAATLRRLRSAVCDEGGLLAAALRGDVEAGDAPDTGGGLGQLAASGPRAAAHREEIALVVEAVREGQLLHHGQARLFDLEDQDLALLAGDRLYALGLERLAALGDLDAVAELAQVISLCAQALADDTPELAEAAFEAGAAAVGWGASAQLRRAQAAARAGESGAVHALRAAARQLAGEMAPVR